MSDRNTPGGVHPNPWGRQFTQAEWDASILLGVTSPGFRGRGPLIYGSPQYDRAADLRRQAVNLDRLAADARMLADAVEREWSKPFTHEPDDPAYTEVPPEVLR